jgi:hypothetical protein
VSTADPDLLAFVVHPFLSPERWKPGSDALMARADAVAVNLPQDEPRAPSAVVMEAIAKARPRGEVVVGDVTRPPSAWAPALDVRLRALAGARAAAAGTRA